MTVEECIEYYEETGVDEYYQYDAAGNRLTLKLEWQVGLGQIEKFYRGDWGQMEEICDPDIDTWCAF